MYSNKHKLDNIEWQRKMSSYDDEKNLRNFLGRQAFAYNHHGEVKYQCWGNHSVNIVISYFDENDFDPLKAIHFLKSDFGKCVLYEFNKIKTYVHDNEEQVIPNHFSQAIINAQNNFDAYKSDELITQSKKIVCDYMIQ
jgi:hypothetical protein